MLPKAKERISTCCFKTCIIALKAIPLYKYHTWMSVFFTPQQVTIHTNRLNKNKLHHWHKDCCSLGTRGEEIKFIIK